MKWESTTGIPGSRNDDRPYVRGRAAEALGLYVRGASDTASFPEDRLAASIETDEDSFVLDRSRSAVAGGNGPVSRSDRWTEIESLDAIRDQTDDIVDEITVPSGECPHCGLALPKRGPPM